MTRSERVSKRSFEPRTDSSSRSKFRLEHPTQATTDLSPPHSTQDAESGSRHFFMGDVAHPVFDPKLELDALVRRTQDNPEARIREIQIFKERLAHQQAGLQETIQLLYTKALEDRFTSESFVEINRLIAAQALKYAFSDVQLEHFQSALMAYHKSASNVEEVLTEYPTGSELFFRCYGQAPKGTIELLRKPSCLILIIENPEDYRVAHGAEAGKPHQMADGSIGTFHGSVAREPRLDGALITMRREERREKATEQHIQNGTYSFSLSPDTQVLLESEAVGNWEIRCSFHRGALSEVRFLACNDVKIELPHLSFQEGECYIDGEPSGSEDFYFHWDDPVWVGKPSFHYLEIIVDSQGYATISEDTTSGTKIRLNPTIKPATGGRTKSEEETITHELRHHLNYLFMPVTEALPSEEIISTLFTRYAHEFQGDTFQEALKPLLLRLIREERHQTVDANLQDELLAFYEEGTSLEAIEATLIRGDLYLPRYLKDWKSTILIRVKDALEDASAKGSRLVHRMRTGKIYRDPLPGNQDGLIDEAIRESFKDAAQDVRDWLDAVRLLESTGLSRTNVMSLINQAPASEWQMIAARYIQVHHPEQSKRFVGSSLKKN